MNGYSAEQYKKLTVGLAAGALGATFVSKVLINSIAFVYDFLQFPFISIETVMPVLPRVLLYGILSLLFAVLFFLFCSMLGQKPAYLTGIPRIGALLLSVYFLVQTLIELNEFGADFSAKLIRMIWLIVNALFVTLYMLCVTKAIKNAKAAIISTAAVGGVILLETLYSKAVTTVYYLSSDIVVPRFKIQYTANAIFSCAAGALTVLAMIFCVVYVFKSKPAPK